MGVAIVTDVSDINDPSPMPETPWEFFPDDDVRDELSAEEPPPAEADAMHVETSPRRLDRDPRRAAPPAAEADAVVHYFADEHPEIPDASVPPATDPERTPEVEALLIRQHYLPDDEAETPGSD